MDARWAKTLWGFAVTSPLADTVMPCGFAQPGAPRHVVSGFCFLRRCLALAHLQSTPKCRLLHDSWGLLRDPRLARMIVSKVLAERPTQRMPRRPKAEAVLVVVL